MSETCSNHVPFYRKFLAEAREVENYFRTKGLTLEFKFECGDVERNLCNTALAAPLPLKEENTMVANVELRGAPQKNGNVKVRVIESLQIPEIYNYSRNFNTALTDDNLFNSPSELYRDLRRDSLVGRNDSLSEKACAFDYIVWLHKIVAAEKWRDFMDRSCCSQEPAGYLGHHSGDTNTNEQTDVPFCKYRITFEETEEGKCAYSISIVVDTNNLRYCPMLQHLERAQFSFQFSLKGPLEKVVAYCLEHSTLNILESSEK